jgi:hypothetical protein
MHATPSVSMTKGGTATQQQARSSARFQAGSGLSEVVWPRVNVVFELRSATGEDEKMMYGAAVFGWKSKPNSSLGAVALTAGGISSPFHCTE